MKNKNINKRRYIGDGVYVDYDGFYISLITPADCSCILLDPDVIIEFTNYLSDVYKEEIRLKMEEK